MAGTKVEDPGVQKLVFGAFGLPFGLTMVIVCGAELVTGNFAVMTAGYMQGVVTAYDVGRNWLVAFLGNFAGSLLIVWLN
jgi:formate/nitrite transporter FocA (FNT family)